MPTPTRTTNAKIVQAARELLEEGGRAGLTMNAVAARVGVRAPSLYKRFQDRDALLRAVAVAAVETLTTRLDDVGPDLEKLAVAYRQFAHASPEAFRLIFSTPVPRAALQRSAEPVIDATTALVGEEHALDAARLFTAWATGFIQMELAGSFQLGGDVEQAFGYGVRNLIAGLRA